jgi:transmembrane sensor
MNNPDQFDDLAHHVRNDQQSWDTDAAWSRLHARLQPKRRNRTPWLIAAMILMALGTWVLTRALVITDSAADLNRPSIVYNTGIGETKTVTLADGSTIVLAPQSRIHADDFSKTFRSLDLEGQAFFNVARDPKHPFEVHTRQTRVRVLGTSFEVNAADSGAVRVAVASGRVQVNNTLVTPGQLATVENGQVNVRTTNVQQLTSWRTGQLVFSNVRFSEAAATLERWHDVDIEIPDAALANTRVSAAFAQQSIDEIVQVLGETLDARVVRAGRRLIFQPK